MRGQLYVFTHAESFIITGVGVGVDFKTGKWVGEREKKRGRERERERETSVCCSIYSCPHWLVLVCALTGIGVWGDGTSQLSYPARAQCRALTYVA